MYFVRDIRWVILNLGSVVESKFLIIMLQFVVMLYLSNREVRVICYSRLPIQLRWNIVMSLEVSLGGIKSLR